ncbi:MAG TPA: TetR/AcrR family transcriptional regulator [Acidimicrobiales bacterium]
MSESRIGRRRRDAQKEGGDEYLRRKQEVVAAGAQAFAEIGYDKATFADVARLAGINRASVYYYFSSKEELLREVVKEATAHNVASVEAIERSSLSPEDKLRRAIEELMASYSRYYPHMYVLLRMDYRRLNTEGDEQTRAVLQLAARYEESFTRIVAEGQASGIFHTVVSARVTAMSILGMVNWTHRWYVPGGLLSAEEIGRALADLALRGLLAGNS